MSGKNKISLSLGIAFTIFTAFDEVQQ